MSLSQKLNAMVEKSLQNESLTKQTSDLSHKKYELLKSLKDMETTLSIKQDQYEKVHKRVISLSCELRGLQEQTKIAKQALESLVQEVFEQEAKTSDIQSNLWGLINDWVDRSSEIFQEYIAERRDCGMSLDCSDDEDEKEVRLQQLKLEGQFEALRAYEKYQLRKIKEIEEIKFMVENVDNLPYFE